MTGCTSGLHQGFIVGITLFNIFIHDLGGGMECALSKFVGNKTLEGAAVVQRTWTDWRMIWQKLMKFKGKWDLGSCIWDRLNRLY